MKRTGEMPTATISEIARELGVSRDMVRTRLASDNVPVARHRGNHPVYRVSLALVAIHPDRYRLCPHCGEPILRG